MIEFTAATLAVYGLLTASIMAVWYRPPILSINKIKILLWSILLLMSLIFALIYKIVEIGAALYLVGLMIACHMTKTPNYNIYIRYLFAFIVIAMVIALFLHKVPFFNNPLVFDQFFKSAGSAGYTKYWNYDKAVSGLILLAFFGDLCSSRKEFINNAKKIMPISIITIAVSIALAVMFGYMVWDVSFTTAYFAWAWANLFFTCVSEEMLFRGFVQKHLLKIAKNEYIRLGVVIFAGILFGLAHFAGGTTYIILASVAGIGYGLTYYKTGKIEFAILTHFLLNSIHFIFFSYPFAVSGA